MRVDRVEHGAGLQPAVGGVGVALVVRRDEQDRRGRQAASRPSWRCGRRPGARRRRRRTSGRRSRAGPAPAAQLAPGDEAGAVQAGRVAHAGDARRARAASPRPSSTNSTPKTKPAPSRGGEVGNGMPVARARHARHRPRRAAGYRRSRRPAWPREGSAYFSRSAFQNTTRAAGPAMTGRGGCAASMACSASSASKAGRKLAGFDGPRAALRSSSGRCGRGDAVRTVRVTIMRRSPPIRRRQGVRVVARDLVAAGLRSAGRRIALQVGRSASKVQHRPRRHWTLHRLDQVHADDRAPARTMSAFEIVDGRVGRRAQASARPGRERRRRRAAGRARIEVERIEARGAGPGLASREAQDRRPSRSRRR